MKLKAFSEAGTLLFSYNYMEDEVLRIGKVICDPADSSPPDRLDKYEIVGIEIRQHRIRIIAKPVPKWQSKIGEATTLQEWKELLIAEEKAIKLLKPQLAERYDHMQGVADQMICYMISQGNYDAPLWWSGIGFGEGNELIIDPYE